MRTRRLRAFAAVSILVLLVVPGYGHAILLSATPALNATVKGPDITVRLRFNARIDSERSRLILLATGGNQRILSVSRISPPDTLNAEAKGLVGGSYILRWQVLANDGHITRGEVPFVVQ